MAGRLNYWKTACKDHTYLQNQYHFQAAAKRFTKQQ